MSRLGNIIAKRIDAIGRRIGEAMFENHCELPPSIAAGAPDQLLATLLAVAQSQNGAASRWAADLCRDDASANLTTAQVLSGLHCLDSTVATYLVESRTDYSCLADALAEAAAAVEQMRQAYLAKRAQRQPPVVEPPSPSVRQLERTLAETKILERAILESSLDPIITIDHEGKIAEFNRAAEQTFGYTRDQVIGTKLSDVLFPPTVAPGQQGRIDRYLSVGEGSMLGKRAEVVAVRADGDTFPAELAMTINQQAGEPVLTFFIRDISLRKQIEQEKARHAEELERSNYDLQQFAYVASHDLQEPLRKIRTFGDRLESCCRDKLDETGRECVDRMQSAAARMQLLIDGLLSLSRVATGVHEVVPVDLGKVAEEVVSDLEAQIEQAAGRVEIARLPIIQADPVQMRQLLQNLIGNALKFRRADEPPIVKLSGRFVHGRTDRPPRTGAKEELCRLLIEDNGIGFDPKHAERIFGVFQRLHPRDVYDGTGIGLAICRRIVERHRGTITARSTPGVGSTFEIILPVTQPKSKKSVME